MDETCAVCKKGIGPTKCEICGFSDDGSINRNFPVPEDLNNWFETVVKPYRVLWEAKKRENELLAQLEEAKKREAELLVQLSGLPKMFTDPRDGQVYRTVKIGNQVWMAENLNFDCPGSECYDNDPKNAEKYGRLYDWETAKKACPPGWHLPSKEEWQTLVDFAGGEKIAGKKLKAKNGWNYYKVSRYQRTSGNGTNDYGFSALPGGGGFSDDSFFQVGKVGVWWSSASKNGINGPNFWGMSYNNDYASWNYEIKAYLFSVRCVQDKA
jgi:uncharacterized protein (TIGR02145 family)